MNSMTYFVTLNWNTTALLKAMVTSVERMTPEPHRWVIVENGSAVQDEIALYNWLHAYFSDVWVVGTYGAEGLGPADDDYVIVVRSDENLGCIGGHNLAFDTAQRLSGGESAGRQGQPHEIVMVDTDVVLLEYGWLSRVRGWADQHPVGVVGLEHSQGDVCAGAVFLDPSGNWYIHSGQTNRAEPVEGESVGLGLALIRRPVLEAGLRFDPGFKTYYKQDDDFCFQVRADLGLEVWAFPIGCIHWGSGSLQANAYEVGGARGWNEFDQVKQANQRYFVEKWRWALADRRATLDQEARHLVDMKQIMQERRRDDEAA